MSRAMVDPTKLADRAIGAVRGLVGPEVTNHQVGDRVVVVSFIGCGSCWYCDNDLWSLCDNTNTNPGITQGLWGHDPGGIFGYSHAMGGFMGSHAEYVRVPFADHGAFTIPAAVDDLRAVLPVAASRSNRTINTTIHTDRRAQSQAATS